jgi:hypothetical protein
VSDDDIKGKPGKFIQAAMVEYNGFEGRPRGELVREWLERAYWFGYERAVDEMDRVVRKARRETAAPSCHYPGCIRAPEAACKDIAFRWCETHNPGRTR